MAFADIDVFWLIYAIGLNNSFTSAYETEHDKTNKMARAPSEDLNQPGPV